MSSLLERHVAPANTPRRPDSYGCNRWTDTTLFLRLRVHAWHPVANGRRSLIQICNSTAYYHPLISPRTLRARTRSRFIKDAHITPLNVLAAFMPACRLQLTIVLPRIHTYVGSYLLKLCAPLPHSRRPSRRTKIPHLQHAYGTRLT